MRSTVTITDKDKFFELIEEGQVISESRAKWGTDITYLVTYKEEKYILSVLSQPQEGLQFYGDIILYPAKPVTKQVTVWEIDE